MQIILTFDWELFFGKNSGTVDQCIIHPVREILRIGEQYQIPFTFFIDVGYVYHLHHLKDRYPELLVDYQKVRANIDEIIKKGHDVQLHIHPHWEKTVYKNGKWHFDHRFYSFDKFEHRHVLAIFKKYTSFFTEITGRKPFVFRAGGWCIQPFAPSVKRAFEGNGIEVDSSVFRNGYLNSGTHSIDFRGTPKQPYWRFNNDPVKEVDEHANFIEVPITAKYYSPLFYWKFLFFKKIANKQHKSFGDGFALPNSLLFVFKCLLFGNYSVLSTDGYKAQGLKSVCDDKELLVTIGHPKAITPFSLKKMEEFVQEKAQKHTFTTYNYFKGK